MRNIDRLILLLAFLGVFIAGSLSASHALNLVIPCGAASGCETVAQHPSSKVGGIPVAYLGFFAYVLLAALTGTRLMRGVGGKCKLFKAGWVVSGAGTLISLYLTYVALFVIQARCPWCLASAGVLTLIFLLHTAGAGKPDYESRRIDVFITLAFTFIAGGAVAMQVGAMKATADTPVVEAGALAAVTAEQLVPEGAHILGDPEAPITIVEFTDLTCSACRAMSREVEDIPKRFPGIRIVFRHLPLYELQGHEAAMTAAMVAEMAAEKGKFWEFAHDMFALEHQPTDKDVVAVAEKVGLNAAEVEQRLKTGKEPLAAIVERDRNLAEKLGLKGTPSFIVLGPDGVARPATVTTLPKIMNLPEFRPLLKGKPR